MSIQDVRLVFFVMLLVQCQTLFAYDVVVPHYALVIGNADYGFAPLRNPVNDARAMSQKLTSLGYQVTVATNQNPEQMRDLVTSFYKKVIEKDAVTLFYFSGHGVQAGSVNYLLPVSAGITNIESLISASLSSNELLRALGTASSMQNILIFDACRNNPFDSADEGELHRGVIFDVKERSLIGKGLAPIKAPRGTLIAYATAPGNVALDGSGKNGTYTAALLKMIDRSETAEELFKKVRKEVLKKTRNRQVSWEHSSLVETFYFKLPTNKEIPDIPVF